MAQEEQQWCDDNLAAWLEFTSYTQLRKLVKTVNQQNGKTKWLPPGHKRTNTLDSFPLLFDQFRTLKPHLYNFQNGPGWYHCFEQQRMKVKPCWDLSCSILQRDFIATFSINSIRKKVHLKRYKETCSVKYYVLLLKGNFRQHEVRHDL